MVMEWQQRRSQKDATATKSDLASSRDVAAAVGRLRTAIDSRNDVAVDWGEVED